MILFVTSSGSFTRESTRLPAMYSRWSPLVLCLGGSVAGIESQSGADWEGSCSTSPSSPPPPSLPDCCLALPSLGGSLWSSLTPFWTTPGPWWRSSGSTSSSSQRCPPSSPQSSPPLPPLSRSDGRHLPWKRNRVKRNYQLSTIFPPKHKSCNTNSSPHDQSCQTLPADHHEPTQAAPAGTVDEQSRPPWKSCIQQVRFTFFCKELIWISWPWQIRELSKVHARTAGKASKNFNHSTLATSYYATLRKQ